MTSIKDYTQQFTEDDFVRDWHQTFGEVINPKDELFRLIYIQYCMALAGEKLLLAVAAKGKKNTPPVYNFPDGESVRIFAEQAAEREKKKFIRYSVLSAIIVIFMAFIFIFSGRSGHERDMDILFDISSKEIIDGTPYIKLKPMKNGEAYQLGRHIIIYDDSTFVIPVTSKKLQLYPQMSQPNGRRKD